MTATEVPAAVATAAKPERWRRVRAFLAHPVTRLIFSSAELLALAIGVLALVYSADQSRKAAMALAEQHRMSAYQLLTSGSYEVAWEAAKVLVENGDVLQGFATGTCPDESACPPFEGMQITAKEGAGKVRNITAERLTFQASTFRGLEFDGGSLAGTSFLNSDLDLDIQFTALQRTRFIWSKSGEDLPTTKRRSAVSIYGAELDDAVLEAPDLSVFTIALSDLSDAWFYGALPAGDQSMQLNWYLEGHPPRLEGGVSLDRLVDYVCAADPPLKGDTTERDFSACKPFEAPNNVTDGGAN